MPKLNDQEFQFLIDAALDTKDEEMFKDLIKKQEEGKFLEFPKQQIKEEVLSFEAKEKKRLMKDMETIINGYKSKNPTINSLENMIFDLSNAIDCADERLMREAMKEEGTMALNAPLDFPPLPQIQYMAVSYEKAMDAYKKHAFPNEKLDMFVERYFFGENRQDEF